MRRFSIFTMRTWLSSGWKVPKSIEILPQRPWHPSVPPSFASPLSASRNSSISLFKCSHYFMASADQQWLLLVSNLGSRVSEYTSVIGYPTALPLWWSRKISLIFSFYRFFLVNKNDNFQDFFCESEMRSLYSIKKYFKRTTRNSGKCKKQVNIVEGWH